VFWLNDYLLFLLKIVTVLVAAILFVVMVSQIKKKNGDEDDPHRLKVKHMNKKLKKRTETLQHETVDKNNLKALKKEAKQKKKEAKNNKTARPKSFLIHFKGDMQPHGIQQLSDVISAILDVANSQDDVVMALESPGGTVHGYGLAAAQLERFRKKNIPLTVVIDKVAASGGYLMAVVANQIIAAPFAVIGSIGVIMQQPNFHRFLQKKHIDFEQITAGDHKRNLSLFVANTPEGREQAQRDTDQIHHLFKSFVSKYRPTLDIETLGDGRVWHGSDALKLGLIDEENTLAHLIQQRCATHEVYDVSMTRTPRLIDKIHKQLRHAMTTLWGVDGQNSFMR
jgi:serine protease SohB